MPIQFHWRNFKEKWVTRVTFEIESITYQLGEEEILVRDLCDRNNLNFDRLITRSGFETVYRTNLSEEDFFSEFIKMNLSRKKQPSMTFYSTVHMRSIFHLETSYAH